jgi:hypothetical protein
MKGSFFGRIGIAVEEVIACSGGARRIDRSYQIIA